MFDTIAREGRRLWKAEIMAWVKQDEEHELCIFKRKGFHLLPLVVARYNLTHRMFVESRSFKIWLEAWVHFTARAEMDFDGEPNVPQESGRKRGKRGGKA